MHSTIERFRNQPWKEKIKLSETHRNILEAIIKRRQLISDFDPFYDIFLEQVQLQALFLRESSFLINIDANYPTNFIERFPHLYENCKSNRDTIFLDPLLERLCMEKQGKAPLIVQKNQRYLYLYNNQGNKQRFPAFVLIINILSRKCTALTFNKTFIEKAINDFGFKSKENSEYRSPRSLRNSFASTFEYMSPWFTEKERDLLVKNGPKSK